MGPDGLIIIVVLAVVVLFGGSKLPQLARSLGGASHEFKSASEEFKKASEAGRGDIDDPQIPLSPKVAEGRPEPESNPAVQI